MITVLDAIKLSTDYLEKKNVESPRANSEILLCEILNCRRIDLYLSFDKPLNDKELSLLRESIRKRGMRIPLQYITGYVEFYGLRLKVNESVLIPRPETELLVERVINCCLNSENINILDIGSGSGNISLALAKNIPNSKVTGIDISEKAVEIAKMNAESNSVENVLFKKSDVFDSELLSSLGKFDLIVSNPPYVSENDFKKLEPELKFNEPRIALTDESDGLNFYRQILSSAEKLLNAEGRLFFEIGKDQHEQVAALMREKGIKDIKMFRDYSGIYRIIFGAYI